MLGKQVDGQDSYRKATELLATALKANPRNGSRWATLAFYHAKIGDASNAQIDLKNAEAQGAKDVQSQFMMTQALALLGRNEKALKLLLSSTSSTSKMSKWNSNGPLVSHAIQQRHWTGRQ